MLVSFVTGLAKQTSGPSNSDDIPKAAIAAARPTVRISIKGGNTSGHPARDRPQPTSRTTSRWQQQTILEGQRLLSMAGARSRPWHQMCHTAVCTQQAISTAPLALLIPVTASQGILVEAMLVSTSCSAVLLTVCNAACLLTCCYAPTLRHWCLESCSSQQLAGISFCPRICVGPLTSCPADRSVLHQLAPHSVSALHQPHLALWQCCINHTLHCGSAASTTPYTVSVAQPAVKQQQQGQFCHRVLRCVCGHVLQLQDQLHCDCHC